MCVICRVRNRHGRRCAVPYTQREPRLMAGVRDANRVCLDQGASSCGSNGRCDGRGGCQRYGDGTVCRDASCDPGSNSETPAGVCRAGACTSQARSCAPFQGCNGNGCSTFCASNAQCAGGAVCQGGSC